MKLRLSLPETNDEAAYYTGRVLSSQFYISLEFPKFFGKATCILFADPAPLFASQATFTGSPQE